MRPLTTVLALWLLPGLISSVAESDIEESFAEELYLKPLTDGKVLAYAQFTTLSGRIESGKKMRHFDLMPKVVGEFVDDHGLHEVRVALTRGVWRSAGDQTVPVQAAPAGALVHAVFQDRPNEDVNYRWRRLTNALSGQFCASLNFLDSERTSQPEWILGPMGVDPPQTVNGTARRHLRFGTLPGENVCTENLTPWKKLLPCGGKRGIGSLLNARSIHRTNYHSIGLTMRRVCPKNVESGLPPESCIEPRVELVASITLVFDPSAFPENANKVTKLVKLNGNDWSVRSLFGMGITSKCPMASESRVYVATSPDIETVLRLDPKSTKPLIDYKDDKVHVYDVDEMLSNSKYNIGAYYSAEFSTEGLPKEAPVISASRHQTGYGQEVGGIVTQIRNSGPDPLTIVLYDVLPWYLRVYFHTLSIEARMTHGRVRKISPLKSKFVPGLDRAKPYTLELVLTLPPKSTTKVSLGFEHSILKWNEYPPDANKGFYVGSALIATLLKPEQTRGLTLGPSHSTIMDAFATADGTTSESDLVLVQLYTESLLVSLPTPDFSMPYNVICLACTVVALAFGPLLNLTTKTLQVEEESTGGAEGKPVSKLASILEKVPILNKLMSKKMAPKSDSDELEPSDSQSKSENVNGSANSGENSQSVEDSKKDR